MADTKRLNQPQEYNLEAYPEEVRSYVGSAIESIEHAVEALLDVKKSMIEGSYTRDSAIEDIVNLTDTAGIDYFAALENLAEAECEDW
jgi:hypothetical protein